MLEFGKFNDKWDVKIDGLGCKYFVSEVEKTAPCLNLPPVWQGSHFETEGGMEQTHPKMISQDFMESVLEFSPFRSS